MADPPPTIRHAPWADAPPTFAIGLRPIPLDAWLEGGEADPAARKDPLFAARRDLVWAETEGSRPGQAEVLALIEAAGAKIEPGPDLPPLYAAARAVPDDLCLMERREGDWRLTALSLSAGTFFTAAEVIGKPLASLHAPVPGFGARFLARVARIFDALQPDAVLERRNWTVMAGDDLHAPEGAAVRERIASITPEAAARALFVRVERQTIRKLPATGGVLFTIRVWRHPLAALDADPARRAAFAAAWRGADADFRAYKRLGAYDTLVEAYLRARSE
ncbi:MAG TPA: heme-dependent oxidative N-demethylase subunit alpha family protein [Caulobacteraceae bacterium]|nr:heme-dependent oxidative N-demethylase subunit alpha family protein [Caulobacteraceae bacterium]